MPSPNLSELATTTLRRRSRKLHNNVMRATPLLDKLMSKGKVKYVDGGYSIVEEIEYALNNTFMFYSGYEFLDVSPSDIITAAEYPWKQAAVSVTISGLEQLQNSGSSRVLNLLAKRINNAERTLKYRIGEAVYDDGTGYGGKAINGLGLLVSETPAVGTVGSINAANWPFWRNQAMDSSTNALGPITDDNIVQYMDEMSIALSYGRVGPDLIIAGKNRYLNYLNALRPLQRIMAPEEGGAGFSRLKYYGGGRSTDVVLDSAAAGGGAQGGGAPEDSMYFLNTDFMYMAIHPDRDFETFGGDRMNTNQDAIVRLIGMAGNLTTSNRATQGVIF